MIMFKFEFKLQIFILKLLDSRQICTTLTLSSDFNQKDYYESYFFFLGVKVKVGKLGGLMDVE